MPEHRRLHTPGASIFFTVVTDGRRPILTQPRAIDCLRTAFREEMAHHPFCIESIVILPDHLHTIWTLPPGDSSFSIRWARIKGDFTRSFLLGGGRERPPRDSKAIRGERGVWQRRFWDHVIRDDDEWSGIMDYIHWNPVKHGLVGCPHEWPYSSFARCVFEGRYPADWLCDCKRPRTSTPQFDMIERAIGDVD